MAKGALYTSTSRKERKALAVVEEKFEKMGLLTAVVDDPDLPPATLYAGMEDRPVFGVSWSETGYLVTSIEYDEIIGTNVLANQVIPLTYEFMKGKQS